MGCGKSNNRRNVDFVDPTEVENNQTKDKTLQNKQKLPKEVLEGFGMILRMFSVVEPGQPLKLTKQQQEIQREATRQREKAAKKEEQILKKREAQEKAVLQKQHEEEIKRLQESENSAKLQEEIKKQQQLQAEEKEKKRIQEERSKAERLAEYEKNRYSPEPPKVDLLVDNYFSDQEDSKPKIDTEQLKADRIKAEQQAEAEARQKAAKIKEEQEAQLQEDRGAMNSMEDMAANILSKYK